MTPRAKTVIFAKAPPEEDIDELEEVLASSSCEFKQADRDVSVNTGHGNIRADTAYS